MGSVMIEENVVSAAGTTYRTTTDELVHLIRAMGKTPVQRDTLYREVKVFAERPGPSGPYSFPSSMPFAFRSLSFPSIPPDRVKAMRKT
jgi:hypothetical protein